MVHRIQQRAEVGIMPYSSVSFGPPAKSAMPTVELPAEQARNQSMDATEAAREDLRASVTVDRDGIIRQWGDAVTGVVGYSAADTVGQSLNVVIPPALRPLHWRGLGPAGGTGRVDPAPV